MTATSLASLLAAKPINTTPHMVSNVNNSYQQDRKEFILNVLKESQLDSLVHPNDSEISYVNSVFQNKKFNNLDDVTYEKVISIGREEMVNLNNELKKFTKSVGGVKIAGIFGLIDSLSENIEEANLDEIWTKAVNAKPTILAYLIGLFNNKAKTKSVSNKLGELSNILQQRKGTLETKVAEIEANLLKEEQVQAKNIKFLQESFQLYFNTFEQLRKQFVLIVFLEHSYKSQLENYKESIKDKINDLSINKKLNDYEQILLDIQNQRLILHKTLLQLPITADQANTLINVSKNIVKEIQSTTLSKLNTIRSALLNLVVCLDVQRSLLNNSSIQNLEQNLQTLAARTTGRLAETTATLQSEARLREAENMAKQIADLREQKNILLQAKERNKQNIQQAEESLLNSTSQLKDILSSEQ